MRKVIYFLALLLLASCGSNKGTQSSRKKLEKDECQTMAETKSEFIRGYGIGTSPDMMLARDIAAMNARNDMASSIEAGVMSFLKRYSNQHTETQVDGNGNPGQMRALTGKEEGEIKQIVDQSIKGSKIICSNSYELKNGLIEVHICIEMNSDVNKAIYKQLSENKILKIDFDEKRFNEEMQQELDSYRKSKQ